METGTFPAGIAAQMEQAIKNIGEVLAAADCRLDDVVKVTTYITPEAYAVDEEAVLAEEIYTRAFSAEPKPAPVTSDEARFDRAVLGRALNILEAAQILLPVAQRLAGPGRRVVLAIGWSFTVGETHPALGAPPDAPSAA